MEDASLQQGQGISGQWFRTAEHRQHFTVKLGCQSLVFSIHSDFPQDKQKYARSARMRLSGKSEFLAGKNAANAGSFLFCAFGSRSSSCICPAYAGNSCGFCAVMAAPLIYPNAAPFWGKPSCIHSRECTLFHFFACGILY